MSRFGNKGASSGRKKYNREAVVYDEKAAASNNEFDSYLKPGINKYMAKDVNAIRVLPPYWSDDAATYYSIGVHLHYSIGIDKVTVLCPRKMYDEPCPICEEMDNARSQGDKEYAKELSPSQKFLMYVVDRQEEDKGVLLYPMPISVERNLATQAVDAITRAVINIDDVDEGYDITFKKTGKGMTTQYEGISIARQSSPLASTDRRIDEWLDFVTKKPLPDVLQKYSYEYLQQIFNGSPIPQKDDLKPVNLNVESTPDSQVEAANASNMNFDYTAADVLKFSEDDLIELTEAHDLFTEEEFTALNDVSLADFANAVVERLLDKGIMKKPEATRRRQRSSANTGTATRVEEVKKRFRRG